MSQSQSQQEDVGAQEDHVHLDVDVDDVNDASEEEYDLSGDIKSVQSLVTSMMLVADDLIAKLQFAEKHGFSKAVIISDSIASTGTVVRLLSIAMKKTIRIARKSELIEDENEELARAQDSHAFALNNLESTIKIHKDDKKLLVPLAIKNCAYTEAMSTHKGGNTSCSTCLEDFKEGVSLSVLQCGHYFHRTCALKWLIENKSTCSLCKRHIVNPVDYFVEIMKRKRVRSSSAVSILSSVSVASVDDCSTRSNMHSILPFDQEAATDTDTSIPPT